jgi:DNA-binding NarL/FixJ family response regulator
MATQAISNLPRDAIPRLVGTSSPLLIFEVEFDGQHAAGSARRPVKLIGCVRRGAPAVTGTTDEEGVSALLVLRSLSPARLLSFVGSVSRGGSELPAELVGDLQPRLNGGSSQPLTSRELTVLRLLAEGETTRGIAEQLNYCERTVKNIVRDVLAKLGCRTRAQAVALATRAGVI